MPAYLAAETRPPAQYGGSLGNTNPLEMMSQMMQMRQTQANWDSQNEAGQIISQSGSWDEAINGMMHSPNAGRMLPQINQAREQMRTQADIGRIQAETTRAGAETTRAQAMTTQTQYQTDVEKLHNAILMSGNDPDSFNKAIDAAKASSNPDNWPLFDTAREAATANLPSDPAAARQKFEMNRVGLLVGSGLHSTEAYNIQGTMPPEYRTDIPDPYGLGRTGYGIIGGPGSFPVLGEGTTVPGGAPAAGGETPAPGGALALPGQPQPGTITPRGVQYGAPEGAPEQTRQIVQENADATKEAPSQMVRLDTMVNAMKQFQAGGWAKERMYAAKDLQGLKNSLDSAGLTGIITQKFIDGVGNGSVSGTQLFENQMRPFVTGQLRDAVAGTGAGRIRDEVTAFLNSADASTDPEALLKIINQTKYNLAVRLDRADQWPEFQQKLLGQDPSVKGLFPGDFYNWYNKSDGFKEINKKYGAGGVDTSPFSGTEIRGAKQDEKPPNYGDMPAGTRRVQGGHVFEKQPDGKWTHVENP